MGRQAEPPVPVSAELDEHAAELRLRRIMRGLYPHGLPDSEVRRELEKMTAALWRFRDRMDRDSIPYAEQLPRVEAWLEDRGQWDRVARHVDTLERAEARWSQPEAPR